MKELIAKILYKIGIRPTYSTGICGALTCGYGKLSNCGYWEYPLYEVAKRKDRELDELQLSESVKERE